MCGAEVQNDGIRDFVKTSQKKKQKKNKQTNKQAKYDIKLFATNELSNSIKENSDKKHMRQCNKNKQTHKSLTQSNIFRIVQFVTNKTKNLINHRLRVV